MGLDIQLMKEYEAVKGAKREENRAFEWLEPISFDEYKLPIFPVDVFPIWLRSFVEGVAESTQTPIDAPSFAAISVLSTALAKRFYVRLTSEWSEPLNTYTILALPSGNRKSSVFRALQEPIITFEKEERERLSVEVFKQKAMLKAKQKRLEYLDKVYAKEADPKTLNEIYALSKEIKGVNILTLPRYITEDVTPEKLADLMADNNERMSLLSAEGGGLFNIIAGRYTSDGKANLEIFLKGFSGDYCAIDRIGREGKILEEPALTIGLFLQPYVVKDVPISFQERGLMPRFLYSFPRSLVGHRKIAPQSITEEVKNKYLLNMRKLLSMDVNEKYELLLNKNARKDEEALRGEIEEMFLEGGALEEMKEWGSKLAGQIIRMVGLLHVTQHIEDLVKKTIDEIPREIDEITFSKARKLVQYFIEHAKAAYGCMGADEIAEDAKYLLEVIKRQNKPVVEYRDIQMSTRKRFKKALHLKTTLNELEERRFLYQKKEGRKTFYLVSPFILTSN